MAATTNVVNLDAMIPREDFAVQEAPSKSTPLDRINIAHLDGHFFAGDLRKPDFQRETAQWSPAKVVDLIRSFLDADLIPAIILWRAGSSIFVIDGSHRLSAILAWIKDDYGDRKQSLDHAGGYITSEQKRVAERTRELIDKSVSSYAKYKDFKNNRAAAPVEMQKRLSNLADNSFVAQWVTTSDIQTAEDSFFKINQQGTPIDPTERRLIRSRESASAIASRSITHAGSGHKYWKSFASDKQVGIENAGKEIYNALYNPPITGMPLTTLDVPVAGKGYNALPFVFDLVNRANGVKIPDSTSKKDDKTKLPKDTDGKSTVQFLAEVRKRVERITGDSSRSLGLHPVVYFYTRSGSFQPTVFLAVSDFIEELSSKTGLVQFTKHRRDFEDFLVAHKEATTLLIKQLGSGERHIPRLREYYSLIVNRLADGKNRHEIEDDLSKEPNFAFLTKIPAFNLPPDPDGERHFKRGTKIAAFFATALPQGARCNLCGALVHKNSIQFDHDQNRRDGGSSAVENARVTHPYCNSIKDQLLAAAE
jgi:hypothetical protein